MLDQDIRHITNAFLDHLAAQVPSEAELVEHLNLSDAFEQRMRRLIGVTLPGQNRRQRWLQRMRTSAAVLAVLLLGLTVYSNRAPIRDWLSASLLKLTPVSPVMTAPSGSHGSLSGSGDSSGFAVLDLSKDAVHVHQIYTDPSGRNITYKRMPLGQEPPDWRPADRPGTPVQIGGKSGLYYPGPVQNQLYWSDDQWAHVLIGPLDRAALTGLAVSIS